jgi:predicted HTH transcriptional regulator
LLRVPHASIPRNPLIAEPLFLTRYVEKAGTGILDMIRLCKAAGVPAPQFRQDGGQFVQTLLRPTGGDGAQFVRPESGLESGLESRLESRLGSATSARVLAALAAGSFSRSAIANAVGHKRISGAINRAIKQLLERGLIEPTIADRPRSRLQEYRLTDQGRAWVGGREA